MIQYKNFLFILIFTIIKCEDNPKISWDSNIISKNLNKMILEKEFSVTCDNEEIVNLEGFKLKSIPIDLVKSKTIEAISLNNNEISKVPSDIFHKTPNLKCLNLAENEILFKYFQLEHDHLKKLILDYQSETELHEIFSIPQDDVIKIRFPNLETLSWKYIKYDIFSSTLFPMIKNIYLSDSNLIYVASNITHLFPYLKNIHLENNMIEELIADDFRNVESLYLDKNPLRNLWFNEKYTNLKILSLSNSLHNIDITEINIPSLKTLDLSQNQIGFIHEQMFKNIPFLEDLILSENKLLKFPSRKHHRTIFENETGQAATVNDARYRDMIIQFFLPKLDDIDVAICNCNKTIPHAIQPMKQFNYCMRYFLVVLFEVKGLCQQFQVHYKRKLNATSTKFSHNYAERS
ncbi:leucine-rich repeat-containing protein 40-like [Apis mellifera]|uniref:Leucine-rich repeat-containing protein 40-like n=1 Tax=Apis mellifera TaxID=7460 RepID=A0A7M7KZR9_APIME|nr:leucine-rich repeat-containing protein 40-like [Apis mellifera]|eukprot:XP_026295419.1 leucine-rich repeat-containing protein 40-like [Apis mellifera]